MIDETDTVTLPPHPTQRRIILEVAANSVRDCRQAEAVGADRIELCTDLQHHGLTPASRLISQVRAVVRVPLLVLVRPRPGDFVYSRAEVAEMAGQAAESILAGADGLVFGALNPDGTIDINVCRTLLAVCGETPAVFHRAIDHAPDPRTALSTLAALGFARVLAAGLPLDAPPAFPRAERHRRLHQIVEHARDQIEVVVGGGVRAGNVIELLAETGAAQVHSSCRAPRALPMLAPRFDRTEAARLRAALDAIPMTG